MPSIKKNFFYSSILTTANYIFPFLTYPYVSRVLGVNNIGICNFVDSIVNYFILFSMMGIGIVGIREIAKSKNDKERLNRTFSSLFLLNTISTTIVFVVYVFAVFFVPKLYEHRELMLFGALKLIFNYLNIEWLYKGLENFKYITVRSVLVKCCYVICVYIFIHDKSDYTLYYAFLCGIIVINGFINISYSRKFVRFTRQALTFRPFINPLLTLGLYTFLTSMYTSFNMAYLGFTSGETEVGYYTTAIKLYSILLSLFTAFTGVLLPRMSSLIAEHKMDAFMQLLRKSADILFAFAIPLVIFSVVFAPQIILVLSGNGYEGAILPMRIVMPLMLIIGYEQILVVQTLMPLKEDKIIFRNSVLGALSGLTMNIILVANLHSVGSAIVWAVSEIVVLISAQSFLSKHYKIYFPAKKLLSAFTYHVPLLICVLLVSRMHTMPIVQLAVAMAISLVYCFVLQVFIVKNETVVGVYNKVVLSKIKKHYSKR